MSESPTNQILIVDDDPSVRVTLDVLLAYEGYEFSTAEDGFDALLQMKSKVPELIVSDLNMPQMSEFFSAIQLRPFRQVLVIAMGGAYKAGDAVSAGIIADAFTAKAPIAVSRNGKDSRGIPYILLTFTECERAVRSHAIVNGDALHFLAQ